ncbi:hypothetical protein NLJ89_g8008 [Agrocybe chaxingu]|uniref:Uncharacterized protein n=1 Tax=Agrocybe chaxingu TaxID=84603 RepID=A0A9W8JVJ9_9AGAR|nr:hypothetical protein NLJ89_g8008 [Agrocybe chaxingu]
MSTRPPYAPSSLPSLRKLDAADFEPDEQWKTQLKKRIEEGLQSMVQEAKDNQDAELKKAPVGVEARMRLAEEYKQAMSNIKQLATDQYQQELDRERNQPQYHEQYQAHR